jgi:AcrR family transcriptional regulator
MSGKPQFEEGAVITAAVDVFWRRGFAAASISDLTQATGLSRSSLYQRFGDKDGLFLEAFQAYTERVLRRMQSAGATTSRGRIEAILRAFLPSGATRRPAGCLIARSCGEAGELSPQGRAAATTAVARQREVLVGVLRDGVRDGELACSADLEALSWHYLAVLQAVVSFSTAGAATDMPERMIQVAMTAWPLASEGTEPRCGT